MSVTPTHQKRGSISKDDSTKKTSLYRIHGEGLCRMPLNTSSLHQELVLLLVIPSVRVCFIWHGVKAGNIDKGRAGLLAQRILEFDLQSPGSSPTIIDATTPRNNMFWDTLSHKGAPPPPYTRPAPGVGQCSLHVLRQQPWFLGGQLGWAHLRSSICDKNNNKFNSAELVPTGAFFLDCPGGECYLWIGPDFPVPERENARRLAQEKMRGWGNSSTLVEVGQNREIVPFTKRFANTIDNGSSSPVPPPAVHRITKSNVAVSSSQNVKPLSAEVSRMLDTSRGTLYMKERDVGDAMRDSLPLHLVEDPSGVLRVWRVGVRGSWSIGELPPEDIGLFSSDGASIILYSCKNGSKHVMYLWQGLDIPATARAAVTIQAKQLAGTLGISGGCDQLMVEQGCEPPFLLKLFSHRKCHFIAVAGGGTNGSNPRETVSLRVEESTIFPNKGVLAAYEVEESLLTDLGRHAAHSYMTFVGLGTENPAVQLSHGAAATKATREFAESLSERPPVRLLKAAGKISNKPLKASVKPRRRNSHGSALPKVPLRPVRLWEISNQRRTINASFVEEVGPGEVFKQKDLQQRECYLLDAGALDIYVWHGPASDERTRMLACIVARKYAEAAGAKINITNVFTGSEPLAFAGCFRYWSLLAPEGLSTLSFDAKKVTEADVDFVEPEKSPRHYRRSRSDSSCSPVRAGRSISPAGKHALDMSDTEVDSSIYCFSCGWFDDLA